MTGRWVQVGVGRSVYRPSPAGDEMIGPDALRPYLNPAVLERLDQAEVYWEGVGRRLHGLASTRRNLRDGSWTSECTCGGLWRAQEYATAVAAVTEGCDQVLTVGGENVGVESDALDAALALAVQLSREATAAGLVVTQLAPMKCHGAYGHCLAVQLWKGDGRLWAEGTHETIGQLRRHIAAYAREHPTS